MWLSHVAANSLSQSNQAHLLTTMHHIRWTTRATVRKIRSPWPAKHYVAYFRVHSRAVWSCLARSLFKMRAISGTSGSSESTTKQRRWSVGRSRAAGESWQSKPRYKQQRPTASLRAPPTHTHTARRPRAARPCRPALRGKPYLSGQSGRRSPAPAACLRSFCTPCPRGLPGLPGCPAAARG